MNESITYQELVKPIYCTVHGEASDTDRQPAWVWGFLLQCVHLENKSGQGKVG